VWSSLTSSEVSARGDFFTPLNSIDLTHRIRTDGAVPHSQTHHARDHAPATPSSRSTGVSLDLGHDPVDQRRAGLAKSNLTERGKYVVLEVSREVGDRRPSSIRSLNFASQMCRRLAGDFRDEPPVVRV
jgi:hypothetical protein